jgi:hypothetical protein
VVTEAELAELLADCPNLYHMAERGSWTSIEKHGLESTTALLDRFAVAGDARKAIESQRRPVSIALERDGVERAMVRDQFPMDDKGLDRCLQDGLSPADWYRLLNAKVFFWLTRDRLLRLLNAGLYRPEEHDVLTLDSASLVAAYSENIWLCPINSGCTKPFPHPRGLTTFRRIADYPYADFRGKRKRGERAVELAVDYAVPDVANFVTKVVRMRGDAELKVLFER